MSKKYTTPWSKTVAIAIDTGWSDALVICRSCARKRGDVFRADGDLPIRKALRLELRARRLRGKVGLIEVGCFGFCPKSGVTVMRASEPSVLTVATQSTLGDLFGNVGDNRNDLADAGTAAAVWEYRISRHFDGLHWHDNAPEIWLFRHSAIEYNSQTGRTANVAAILCQRWRRRFPSRHWHGAPLPRRRCGDAAQTIPRTELTEVSSKPR